MLAYLFAGMFMLMLSVGFTKAESAILFMTNTPKNMMVILVKGLPAQVVPTGEVGINGSHGSSLPLNIDSNLEADLVDHLGMVPSEVVKRGKHIYALVHTGEPGRSLLAQCTLVKDKYKINQRYISYCTSMPIPGEYAYGLTIYRHVNDK